MMFKQKISAIRLAAAKKKSQIYKRHLLLLLLTNILLASSIALAEPHAVQLPEIGTRGVETPDSPWCFRYSWLVNPIPLPGMSEHAHFPLPIGDAASLAEFFLPSFLGGSCIGNKVDLAIIACTALSVLTSGGIPPEFIPDCSFLMFNLFSGSCSLEDLLGPFDSVVDFVNGSGEINILCAAGSVVFDEHCNRVDDPGFGNDCHSVFVYYDLPSPISLLIDGQDRINETPTIVTFPVIPGETGKFYHWKASATAPLLFVDSDKDGVVKSAYQLFGSFTFGRRWDNGYQALASLDSNDDQKLTGDELQGLALWFDHNRNGISESGETKSLGEVGIVTLFVTADEDDTESGDLYATRGFLREVDGKISTGASVDWFTESFDSKDAAAKAIVSSNAPSEQKFPNAPVNGAKGNNEANLNREVFSLEQLPTHQKAIAYKVRDILLAQAPFDKRRNNVTGIWEWEMDKKNVREEVRDIFIPNGLLVIRESLDGKTIQGVSVGNQPLKKGNQQYVSEISLPLKGTKSYRRGRVVLDLEISDPRSKNLDLVTKTTVTLSQDLQSMSGVSTTTSTFKGTKQEKAIRYSWKAARK